MFRILLVLEALCHAPKGVAPDCHIRWETHPTGEQSVLISGHNKRDVVLCLVIDTATANCVLLDDNLLNPEYYRDQDDV